VAGDVPLAFHRVADLSGPIGQTDMEAQVTFEAHPPTQRAGDDQVLLADTVLTGEDDNSGGGSEAGLDASATYTLDLTGIEPHPVRGFHVKLTVSASGATSTSGTSSSSGATTTTVAVGGSSSTGPGGSSPGGGVLPFTGGPGLPMLLAAGALLGLGAASMLVGSRRRRRPTAGM
jgi:hypothetical protein